MDNDDCGIWAGGARAAAAQRSWLLTFRRFAKLTAQLSRLIRGFTYSGN